MSGEKAGAEVFIRDKELAWVPARLLDQTPDKANVSVASYTDELDIDLGGKGATKWTDASVNLKDYAEFGKQLPLQNNKILDDMVDLPYLHEVRSLFAGGGADSRYISSGKRYPGLSTVLYPVFLFSCRFTHHLT